MATKVDESLAEVKAERAELAPILQGLKNYQRLDVQPGTLTYVNEEHDKYVRRDSFLAALESALEAVLDDGYPEIPVRQVPPEVYADLVSENREVDAAESRFSQAVEATSLSPTFGTPEPK